MNQLKHYKDYTTFLSYIKKEERRERESHWIGLVDVQYLPPFELWHTDQMDSACYHA